MKCEQGLLTVQLRVELMVHLLNPVCSFIYLQTGIWADVLLSGLIYHHWQYCPFTLNIVKWILYKIWRIYIFIIYRKQTKKTPKPVLSAPSSADTARALGLLEEYCTKLRKPEEQQLKTAIQRVMGIFKSNLFEALLGKSVKHNQSITQLVFSVNFTLKWFSVKLKHFKAVSYFWSTKGIHDCVAGSLWAHQTLHYI